MVAGAMGSGATLTGAAAEPLTEPWSLNLGAVTPAYQTPSRFEKDVVRTLSNPKNEPRNSHARTPHHLLQRHDHAERPALHHRAFRHCPTSIRPSTGW